MHCRRTNLASLCFQQARRFSQLSKKQLVEQNINPAVVNAEYAVRGAIPIRALQLAGELKNPDNKLPFKKIIPCNIGNPQAVAQTPMTFIREVLAGLTCPGIVNYIAKDAKDRVEKYRATLPMNSIGGYSDSRGVPIVREEIADFIAARDGEECRPKLNDLFITDGASAGIKYVMSCLVKGWQDGVVLPIPQYPLYSAAISLQGGSQIPYFLDEENGWAVDFEQMEESLAASEKAGVIPRAMVVINPGNPTGAVLEKSDIQRLIAVAQKHKLVIFADEVYQENVYTEDKQFHSFKKVMREMGSPYDEVELLSFHSVSKGFLGECGLRGGYMEVTNIDEFGLDQIYKLSSIGLCSNTVGQFAVGLMVNPPKYGDDSYVRYLSERDTQLNNLYHRAKMLSGSLNNISGITTQKIEGAMYAFPSIELPNTFLNQAAEKRMAPDALWCLQLLERSGVVVVPGSGFGQRDGTLHFRTTILPTNEDLEYVAKQMKEFHEGLF